jgi:hypothetical protein
MEVVLPSNVNPMPFNTLLSSLSSSAIPRIVDANLLLSAKDRVGKTPLEIATDRGASNIIKELLTIQSNFNSTRSSNNPSTNIVPEDNSTPVTQSNQDHVTGPFDFGFSSGILFPMLGKDTSVSSPKPRSAVSSPYRFGSLLSPMFGKDTDEESDEGLHPARIASNDSIKADHSNDLSCATDVDTITGDTDLEKLTKEILFPEPVDMNDLPRNFPTEAPFTAHVNNVPLNIKSEGDFGHKIEGLVKYRYQGSKLVKVMSARFGIDRITGKRRGFAYVEFATPEEVSDAFNKNENAKC